MRVKYQTRTLSKTFSTNGGTPEDWAGFLLDVANALIEMGAPLNIDAFEDLGGAYIIPFTGEVNGTHGGACLFIEPGHDEDDNIAMHITAYGRDISNGFRNYVELESKPVVVSMDDKTAGVAIHAVKSGDSFFFGFLSNGSNRYNGCIALAITPMRRLSDPSVNLGYALVEGAGVNGPDEFVGGVIGRTLPYAEGFNYAGGMFNFTTPGYAHAFPEVDTGKIPLIPYYAGIEDIYYDKVYISPMKRGKNEEKAFETDKGVFLIGGEPGVDHTQMLYNTLAFDITEAVESAQ